MTEPINNTLTVDGAPDYHFMKRCIHCKGSTNVGVKANKFHRWWVEKELIQNVWPELTAGQREVMISGMHATCWDKVFPPEMEDDGEDEELNAISEGRDTNNRWW